MQGTVQNEHAGQQQGCARCGLPCVPGPCGLLGPGPRRPALAVSGERPCSPETAWEGLAGGWHRLSQGPETRPALGPRTFLERGLSPRESISRNQWFSEGRGPAPTPAVHLATSGDISGCHSWEGGGANGIWWVEAQPAPQTENQSRCTSPRWGAAFTPRTPLGRSRPASRAPVRSSRRA